MGFENTIEALSLCIQARVPALLEGPVGDAKTSIVTALAKIHSDAFYTSIVAIHEPPDYGGYQLPKEEVRNPEGKVVSPEVVRQVPLDWVHRLAKAKRPLLFLDEFSNGARQTRAATMRGVLEGYWGDAHIENLAVVVAQNPVEMTESGTELSAALSNRFCHLPWDMPVDYWLAQYQDGFPPPRVRVLSEGWETGPGAAKAKAQIMAFATKTPAFKDVPKSAVLRSKPFPTFRSWTTAERALAAAYAAGLSATHQVTGELLGGLVGSATATEFITYSVELDLPDPEEVLRNPKSFPLPDRDDRAYAMLGAVVQSVLTKNTPERWVRAWDVLAHAKTQNRIDVATTAAQALARRQPDGLTELPATIDAFSEFVKLTKIGARA